MARFFPTESTEYGYPPDHINEDGLLVTATGLLALVDDLPERTS